MDVIIYPDIELATIMSHKVLVNHISFIFQFIYYSILWVVSEETDGFDEIIIGLHLLCEFSETCVLINKKPCFTVLRQV